MAHYHWGIEDYINEVENRVTSMPLMKALPQAYLSSVGRDWIECQDVPELIKRARYGYEPALEAARKYFHIFQNLGIDTRVYKWLPNVQGAYPVIPDCLAGSPTPMRSRKKILRDTSPLRIYVGSTLNAAMNVDRAARKGAAIMGLLMLLETIRPVELWIWEDSENKLNPTPSNPACISTVRIGASPLNQSQTAFLLASTGFPRVIMYSMATVKEKGGESFPQNYYILEGNKGSKKYIDFVRAFTGASDSDLFIPSAHTDQIIEDPAEWLLRILHQVMPEAFPAL